ncbi:methionine ABC transporter ATP-binding protein [Hathewaya limosa]|uniref:D-methionine transport system ATP-binding protein n=1 Tax=Hathewaya limosa TaxID=1536 RepID=A0ABU0JWY4_HATLI|nr:ATP-binding cassette domain-containing protein [Hathewaya limosa]MDQ0480432.1 D-methionine transport system ATP-binding protein [Hathewaya limosa]
MIQIKKLSKVYTHKNTSIEALKNINLHIKEGDIFGIMGLSGAGKSSLLRCINALESPTSGEILIKNLYEESTDYFDINKLPKKNLRSVRKKIGMIFQHFNLLMNSTIYENIAFPLKLSKLSKKDIENKVLGLLDLVNLKDKKDMYPSNLSGGEKQRVGIARALANNPKILLCDEATSALDPITTDSIIKLLKKINKELNITIIVITHEMDVIEKLCNKIAVLESGIIAEDGYVSDVFTNPKSKTSKHFLITCQTKNNNIQNSKLYS